MDPANRGFDRPWLRPTYPAPLGEAATIIPLGGRIPTLVRSSHHSWSPFDLAPERLMAIYLRKWLRLPAEIDIADPRPPELKASRCTSGRNSTTARPVRSGQI